ncbi:Csu type fimbrial protein [Ramlibacter humi]|uniref:SCPU domain-containing protein n=1 Tax=Ramlibacter humi TaxID=2530451 RepID=A0A4Z0CC84_9BURK|nr:spore coat U domain-containing protein [Ramlibacter humi]TFZ08512.1 SCPU domain-containing protein [Ramlibacter humi]
MNSRIAHAFAAALLAAAATCHAATACRITSTGGVAFGGYDVMDAAPADTVLNVAVACDRDGGPSSVSVVLRLNQGTWGSSVSARKMRHATSATDFLNYGLYRDIGRSAAWGFTPGIDTVSQTLSVPNKGSASTNFPVYGRIPALQDVRAGSYSDSVQITVTP